MNLDRIDRKILQVIQSDFPLMERPYLQVAESVGISEGEVLERIGRMQEEGLIRRLGGCSTPASWATPEPCALCGYLMRISKG